ncbi:MAG: alpha/beta hydrolase [Lentisphaeria bacterium]|nr:alpha/beta hydrolase [Lentisphaeria bacterium]
MKNCFKSYYLDSPLQIGRVFDVFEADSDVPLQKYAFFFVHGGGWRQGSRAGGTHILMEALAKRGFTCASTDYRLKAPDAFVQISDVREALDAFIDLLIQDGRKPEIIIWGESAGAHLASLTAYAKPGELGEDISKLKHPEIRPAKAILQATPYDFLHFEGMMPQFWSLMQNVAGAPYDKEPERYEKLSLKNYIHKDNPETFFIEAEYEHLFDSRLTLKIAEEHRKMGISSQWKVYERVEHGFLHDLQRKMQLAAFEDMCLFAEDKLKTEWTSPAVP